LERVMEETRGIGRRDERGNREAEREVGAATDVAVDNLSSTGQSSTGRRRSRSSDAPPPRKSPIVASPRTKSAGNGSSVDTAIAFLSQRCSAPPEPTDDILVHAAQAGDERAFEILIERHQRPVFGYFRARVLEAADAEDLCQEVFMRCFQMPVTFEAPIMVRPWLMGIARNVLREHIRKLTRRKEVAWSSLCLDIDEANDPCDDTYDDLVGHLPACIETLGGSARDALDMYYRCRMRLADIGERLRRSEGAVKLLMYRARQALKQCLARKCPVPTRESA
jgi:RNA polymerase sigma-70 factor (ECF subfamily)